MGHRYFLVLLMSSVSVPALAQQVLAPLDEIKVTAQKRTEDVQDVPISVDVWSGQRIEQNQFTRRDQVLDATPNAQMGSATGSLYTNFTAIRGVGSALIDTDPSVGLYVDGIGAGASQTYGGSLLDIARVEILRGPQGTLYGRNNLAGSVNIISNVPDPTRAYGEIGADYGSYNAIRTFGFYNTPIGNTGWAVRGAVSAFRNDGYTPNLATGQNVNSLQDIAGRLSILGPINDSVDFLASIEHEHQRPYDSAYMTDGQFRAGNTTVNLANPFNGTLDTTTGRMQFTARLDNGDRLISLTGMRLNSTNFKGNPFPPNYFAATNAFYGMFGFTGFQYRTDNPFSGSYNQVSQEFRYESDQNARFKWVAGAYGEYSEGSRQYGLTSTFDPGFAGSSMTLSSKGVTDTTAIAAFADGTYALTERWKIFAGARVGYDHKTFDYNFNSNNPVFAPLIAGFSPSYNSSLSAPYVTPRFGTQYDLTDKLNVYASASRGYKSGGFNTGFVAVGDEKAFEAETLWNYEAGWKGRFLNDRLEFNGAAFFMDWRDQQVQTFNVAVQSTPIQNAPKSRSMGGELDARFKLDDHWSLRASAGYVDATYVEFTNALATGSPGVIDVSGNQQQYISKYTATAGIGYTWNVGYDNLVGLVDVSYQYRSSFYFDVANTLRQPGYGLVNARVGVENDRYAAYVWGQNLADQRYRTISTDFGPGPLVAVGAPLMVGGTFKLKFSEPQVAMAKSR